MTKEQLALLGLPETATEEQATAALNLMKGRADNAEQIQLAAVTQAVDQQWQSAGSWRSSATTLSSWARVPACRCSATRSAPCTPSRSPARLSTWASSQHPAPAKRPKTYTKLSEVPEAERLELRKNNRAEYMRLFKEEYGIDCPKLED